MYSLSNKAKLYILMIIMCIVLIPIIFVYKKNDTKYDFNLINHNIEAFLKENNKESLLLKDTDGSKLKMNFNIDISDIEDYVYYYPESAIDVEEICIIKARDSRSYDDIVKKIVSRNTSLKQKFQSYGVDQYSLLLKSNIDKNYPYISYICIKEKDIDFFIKR